MFFSFIISTRNRRDILLATLAHIQDLQLAESSFEIHVIDNASTDGTADAVAAIPHIHLYPQKRNRGSCAKNLAIPHASGKFIIFLDDDSFPQPGAMERLLRHFADRPRLGAASFTVTLPDGSRECSAMPNVFIGCGVALRRIAIDEVGGLPDDFFMQAEEYDLSLRLLNAGWDVQTLDDLHVTHLKTPIARTRARTMRLDVRNNLMLIGKYFPSRWAVAFCIDWLSRYWLIASANRQRFAFFLGMIEGSARSFLRGRAPVTDATFEQFTRIREIKKQMLAARHRYRSRSILFIDLGKNALPYWLAANECGMKIVAIADNRLTGRRFRGVPILSDEQAHRLAFDVAVISNSSPVHAANRARTWRSLDARPVIDLLAPAASDPISTAA